MAPSTKAEQNTQAPGVLTDSSQVPGGASINRKKAKKRQKQAARRAQAAHDALSPDEEGPLDENDLGPEYDSVEKYEEARQYYAEGGQPGTTSHPMPPGLVDFINDTDGENDYVNREDYDANGTGTSSKKKKTKKKKAKPALSEATFEEPVAYDDPDLYTHPPPPPPPPISNDALRTVQRGANKDPIWNNSSQEERARIKEFWLSLGENERKSLVKIERDAVLKKMKEQQKHSCSCTVCGRKRTAIEEELEVLYDAYYEELEQYANHGQTISPNGTPMLPPSTAAARKYIETMRNRKPHKGRITELPDDEVDELDELPPDNEEYSDEEFEEGVDYSGDDTDDMHPGNNASDFFTFGNSLTVKAGGILTVADDLLKNDGQKFIDMMEQLAERRMQREELSAYPYNAYHPTGVPPHTHAPHDHSPLDDDEYDDEDDDYDDEDDDEFEEEDEMVRTGDKRKSPFFTHKPKQDQMTEEQRMEEGRRMFQIFAARMFEQRVLTAYKEKVARERQEKLIQELEAENLADTQRDAKKQRDAEKKKAKKLAQKQAKAEEKAKKDAEKAAEEEAKREEEEKKKDEQRKKRDEARKKKDEERKAQEAERQKKEAEKRERQEAERKQREDAERKARDAKAEEKKRREEAKRKEREEKDATEKAIKDRKFQTEKEKLEQDGLENGERLLQEKTSQEDSRAASIVPVNATSPPAPITVDTALGKRPSLPPVVALPPGLKSRNSNAGLPSPQTKIATPAVPKAPTPVRSKEQLGRGSQNSTPLTPEVSSQSKQSTSPRTSAQQSSQTSSSIGSRGSNPQLSMAQSNQPPYGHPIAPPPGMPFHPQQQQQQAGAFGGMPGMGVNGYPGGQAPHVMHGPRAGQHMPMMPQTGQLHRGFGSPNMTGPPPGMGITSASSHPRGFAPDSAPGYPPQATAVSPGISQPPFASSQVPALPGRHSRQQSASYESQRRDSQHVAQPTAQPISRPAPIKRPTSTKPHEDANSANADSDEFNERLGSRALLDDTDEPLPPTAIDTRRHSAAPGSQPSTATASSFVGSPFEENRNPFQYPAPQSSWRAPSNNFSTPSVVPTNSGWGTTQPAAPGWSSNFPSRTFNVAFRPNVSRHVVVRVLACKACEHLSKSRGSNGFHDLHSVVRLMNDLKSPVDPQVEVKDVLLILDSEPTDSNGGGHFVVSQDAHRNRLVKWEGPGRNGTSAPGGERGRGLSGLGIGEIGSQLPGQGMATLGGLGGGPRGGF